MDRIAKQIIQFMDVVEKLCYVERFATMKNGRKEYDSDHIMKLAFLVLMVSEFLDNKIDKVKLLEMVLIHDLAEADTGDISYMEQYDNPDVIKRKKTQELRTISNYKNLLPAVIKNKILDLFLEYEKEETIESKIVRTLDKLEGDLQCLKDINIQSYCNHNAFLSRINTLKKHKYSDKTNEKIIYSMECILLEISKEIIKKSKK